MSGILTVFAAAALNACELTSLGDCPPDSAEMQSAGRLVVAQQCFRCHSSGVSGDARQDAPENLNFDDLNVVREWSGEMYGESKEGEMPPGLPMSGDEVEKLRIWLACGAL